MIDFSANLVAQTVKRLPVMRETQVRPLGWEDPLEKEIAIHASILGLPLWLSWQRICLQRGRPGSIPGLGRSLGEEKGYLL